jgi:hypothetical protein
MPHGNEERSLSCVKGADFEAGYLSGDIPEIQVFF